MKSVSYAFFLSIVFCLLMAPQFGKSQEISHWIEVKYPPRFLRGFTSDKQGRAYAIIIKESRRTETPNTSYLTVFNPEGKLILERPIPLHKFINAIALDDQGNLILTGMISSSTDNRQMFVEKQTIQGRPLWQHVWDTPLLDMGMEIHVLKNGDILLMGCLAHMYAYKKEDLPNTEFSIQFGKEKVSIRPQDIGNNCLVMLKSDGRIKWGKIVTLPDAARGKLRLAVGPNDGIYLWGDIRSPKYDKMVHNLPSSPMYIGGQAIYFKDSKDVFILNMSLKGEILTTHIINPNQFPLHIDELAIDNEDNLIIGGTISGSLNGFSQKSPPNPTVLQEPYCLAKLSPDGGLIWHKTFGCRRSGYFTGLEVGPKNEIYFSVLFDLERRVCGVSNYRDSANVYWEGQFLENTTARKTYFAAYHGNGELFYREALSDYSRMSIPHIPNNLWAIVEPYDTCHLGGFMLSDSKSSNGYLVHFNLPGTFITPNTTLLEDPLQVFPNASPDRFQLSLGAAFSGEVKLSVADAAGRTLLQRTLHKEEDILQTEIDLGRFAEGAYVLHLSDGWETASKKLVVKK